MNIVLSADDLASFSKPTRNEIMRRFTDTMGSLPLPSPNPAPDWQDQFDDVHMPGCEELTLRQIDQWMRGISGTVEVGVRIIAEHGPVISARRLIDAGVNIRQFQSATTKRTRKVTGIADAYFLAWNRWTGSDDPANNFAVTPITHQSLRRYFTLPV